MFAFGLWDASARRLLLARDRVGIKPLYYAIVPGPRGPALAFGSEPKALLPVPGVGRELDPVALDAYLDLYYVPPPLSIGTAIALSALRFAAPTISHAAARTKLPD